MWAGNLGSLQDAIRNAGEQERAEIGEMGDDGEQGEDAEILR